MAKKQSDFEGWMLRLIEKAEDLRHVRFARDWEKFAETKILDSPYAPRTGKITERQKQMVNELRFNVLKEFAGKTNVTPEFPIRYRIVGVGRFAIRTPRGFKDGKTGRYIASSDVKSEQAIRFRSIGTFYNSRKEKVQGKGTIVPRIDLNAIIDKQRKAKKWGNIKPENTD